MYNVLDTSRLHSFAGFLAVFGENPISFVTPLRMKTLAEPFAAPRTYILYSAYYHNCEPIFGVIRSPDGGAVTSYAQAMYRLCALYLPSILPLLLPRWIRSTSGGVEGG